MLDAATRDALLNTSDSSDSTTSSTLLNRVKFSIFLTLQIPSVLCSVYLFWQYATRSTLRRSIHHHVLIVLLCSSFLFVALPISASEAFFFTSYVRPPSVSFCASWTWIHYSTNVGNLILMAFACGERHWLLFRLNPMHSQGEESNLEGTTHRASPPSPAQLPLPSHCCMYDLSNFVVFCAHFPVPMRTCV